MLVKCFSNTKPTYRHNIGASRVMIFESYCKKYVLQLVLNKVTIFVSGTFLSQFQINFVHAFLLIQFYLERLLGKGLSQNFGSNIEWIWAD